MLFVHAHPGDASAVTGATIAALVEAGAVVTVVTACSTGAALETDPAVDHRVLGGSTARWAGRESRRYFRSELQDDPDDTPPRHPRVGQPAAALAGQPARAPDGPLAGAELGEISADIAAVVIDVRPDVVVGCPPESSADHARVHEAARTAAGVLGVPFYVVDSARAGLSSKRGPVQVSGGASVESFTRLRPRGTSRSEYGLPARIGVGILAAVFGGFVGATSTVVHQAGSPILPWGIIAAVVISTAFIVGLRMVFETRLVAAFGAVGMLAASALLANQSSGGSVLVPANPAGYTWTFAPVLITAVVLAWPRFWQPAVRPVASMAGGNVVSPASKGFDSK